MNRDESPCPVCGVVYGIGDWYLCPHGKYRQKSGFEPHFDIGLGREVTGWGDVHQAMRELGLDYREHPSDGEIAARVDRAREARK